MTLSFAIAVSTTMYCEARDETNHTDSWIVHRHDVGSTSDKLP